MITAWRDWIIFKTNSLFNEHTKFRGIGGRELIVDTKFDPARHATIRGEVVSIPRELSHIKLHQNYRGVPGYVSQSPYSYRWLDDIVPEVQVGDRIYYHFNTIMKAIQDNSFIDVQGVHPNRTWYIKVRYDSIFCAVREGKIIPIQGWAFIDPDWETWKDIAVPTYSDVKDKFGKPILKPESQWIVRKSAPEYKFLEGFVKHVGTPLRGDKCEVKVGQRIMYARNCDWIQAIEGYNYFTMLQRNIIGRFE